MKSRVPLCFSKSVIATLGLAAVLAFPIPAVAGPGACAGTGQFVTGSIAAVYNPTLADPACTAVVVGGGFLYCDIVVMGPTNAFGAHWLNTLYRLNDVDGGCSFTCPGGKCFVGNDGLPVELLRFGVK